MELLQKKNSTNKIISVYWLIFFKNQTESAKMGKGSFAHAWALDKLPEERQHCITMDISIQPMILTNNVPIVIIDTPGHCDYISGIINGCSQSDISILVIDSIDGAFEAGFSKDGQTKQTLIVSKALGIKKLIVAINKLEMFSWSQARYTHILNQMSLFIKTLGFKNSDIFYIPISSLNAINILPGDNKNDLIKSWYSGPSLYELIENIYKEFSWNEKSANKFDPNENQVLCNNLRMRILDVNKSSSKSVEVATKIYFGSLNVNDKLYLHPSRNLLKNNGIFKEEKTTTTASLNEIVTFKIMNVENFSNLIVHGNIISSSSHSIPSINSFKARIIVFNIDIVLTIGFQLVFHNGFFERPIILSKFYHIFEKNSDNIKSKNPRLLTYGNDALIQIKFNQPTILDCFSNDKRLGRAILIHQSKVVAAGIVIELLDSS